MFRTVELILGTAGMGLSMYAETAGKRAESPATIATARTDTVKAARTLHLTS